MITVVSGTVRSGTSMMMKMLEAGGMECLYDRERPSDEDNPHGYYEDKRVWSSAGDGYEWLNEAEGKTVKVLAYPLASLPLDGRTFRVIWMERSIDERVASYRAFVERRGGRARSDEWYRTRLSQHVEKAIDRIDQSCAPIVWVPYSAVIDDPVGTVGLVTAMVGLDGLDVDAMARVVDPSLYRNRMS